MKYSVTFLMLCLNLMPCFCYTTETSKFAEKQYAEQNYLSKVHINVKNEHTIKNFQKIEEKEVPFITFGYGDLKGVNKEKKIKLKKQNISYVCLLDENRKPFWSYIIPFK